jgi:hypothetical protein
MNKRTKTYSTIFIIVLTFTIVSYFSFRQQAQSNNAQESLIYYADTKEPIKIVAFKVGNVSIQNRKKFPSYEHWLKDLRVIVKNKFAKTANYIDIGVVVERPKGEEDKLPFHFTITAGNRKRSLKKLPTGFEIRNNPDNDETEIGVSEREYQSIRESLNRLGFPNNNNNINIIIEEIGFTDGTLWSFGRWFTTDPNDANKLIRIAQNDNQRGIFKDASFASEQQNQCYYPVYAERTCVEGSTCIARTVGMGDPSEPTHLLRQGFDRCFTYDAEGNKIFCGFDSRVIFASACPPPNWGCNPDEPGWFYWNGTNQCVPPACQDCIPGGFDCTTEGVCVRRP